MAQYRQKAKNRKEQRGNKVKNDRYGELSCKYFK